MKYDPAKIVAKKLRAAKRLLRVRTPADKQKYLEGQAKKMDNNPTAPEVAFIELLTSIKVKYETQKIVNGKIFDFYIPEKNTLVEIHGTYWHGYNLPIEEMNDIQKKSHKNDILKETFAKGFGYLFEVVWEHELDDEHFEETKERIRQILK